MIKKILGLLMLMILFTSVAYAEELELFATVKVGDFKVISNSENVTNLNVPQEGQDYVNAKISDYVYVTVAGLKPTTDPVCVTWTAGENNVKLYVTVQPQFLLSKSANVVLDPAALAYIADNAGEKFDASHYISNGSSYNTDIIEKNTTYSKPESYYFDVKEEKGSTTLLLTEVPDPQIYSGTNHDYYVSVEDIYPQITMKLGDTLHDLADACNNQKDNFGNEFVNVKELEASGYVPDDFMESYEFIKEGIFTFILVQDEDETSSNRIPYIFTVRVGDPTPISEINVPKWYSGCIGYTIDPIEMEVYTVNEGADPKAVTIESSDDKVAVVDEDGNIKGTGIGNCTITITSNDDPSISNSFTWYTCAYGVVGNGETYATLLTGYLDNNGNKIDEFKNIISNSNPAILGAEVTGDNEITLTGKGEGYATLKIDQYEQPGVYRYITVHCVNSLVKAYKNQEVKITKELIYNTPSVDGMPFEGTLDHAVLCNSYGELVAEATIENDTIKFTPTVSGPYYLKVYDESEKEYWYYIYIEDKLPVEKVVLNTHKLELIKWNKATLKATVLPKKATDKSLTWKSTNEKVATVNSKGVVRGVGEGTAQIYCVSNDNLAAFDICEVTVAKVRVKIVPNKVTVRRGKSVKVVANVTPNFDYVNQNVKWISSNPKIATVNQFGVITGIKKGTCKVKAISLYDGKTYDTIKVGVVNK